jgi:hypothetical protein
MAQLSERVLTPVISLPQVQPAVRRIPAWKLDPRFGERSTSERALLALDLAAAVPIEPLSRAAALAATGTSVRSFAIAKSLTPYERQMVEAGRLTLGGVVRARRKWAREIAKIA